MTTATTNDDVTTAIHPFEQAGLGKAPFHLAGMITQDIKGSERVLGHVGGCEFTTKPGGTCDFCGTYIINMYRIKSADGKEFTVGSDCVAKLGSADNLLVADVEKKAKAIKAKAAKLATAARKAKESGRIEAILASLSDPMVAERLAVMPHPKGFKDRYTGYPLSLAEYVGWMRANAGHSGMAAVAKMIEKALS